MKIGQMINRSLVLLLMLLGLAACQVTTEESTDEAGTGELVVSLTDADGDFLAYAVDVTSISMTRADGTEVETLPQTTRVDFAQYVELSELLTVATVPLGSYVSGSMTLDFSTADIQVEVNGVATTATVEDADGDPITQMSVDVTLEEHGALVIAPGVPAYLSLDFDLATSNTVDTTATPPLVTVEPVLVADVALEAPKDHRLRGLLAEVNEDNSSIRLALRPFYQMAGNFGRFNAHVDTETVYEIDGVNYSGAQGLAAMAELDLSSWVVVFGSINIDQRRFEASEVYAGDSVSGSDMDSLVGVVLSRSGDQLEFNARAIVRANGGLIFNKTLTIDLPMETRVTRQLSTETYDKDDISVGQRLTVVGQLAEDGDDLSMAAPAHVRMLMNDLGGSVVSVNDGELEIDLQHFNGRPMWVYDFGGSGSSSAEDADPDQYQINTADLSLAGIDIGDPLKARGFVTAFGTAPADLDAETIIKVADVTANMQVTYPFGSTAPFSSSSATAMVIDLQGSFFHHVNRQWVATDLTSLDLAPTLLPNGDGKGLFVITVNGTVYVYTTFTEFETKLSERLAGGARLKRISASGGFDDASASLTANSATAVFREL